MTNSLHSLGTLIFLYVHMYGMVSNTTREQKQNCCYKFVKSSVNVFLFKNIIMLLSRLKGNLRLQFRYIAREYSKKNTLKRINRKGCCVNHNTLTHQIIFRNKIRNAIIFIDLKTLSSILKRSCHFLLF